MENGLLYRTLIEIGRNVKFHRLKQGLTQADLAHSASTDPSAIRRLESGKSNPTVKSLLTISEILKIDLEQLFKKQMS